MNRADDYTNELSFSNNRVVIVAKAALGKGSVQYCNSHYLTEPPDGCDSVSCSFSFNSSSSQSTHYIPLQVLGEVGIDLNYDEQVLFRDEAIRPAFVIIYSDESP